MKYRTVQSAIISWDDFGHLIRKVTDNKAHPTYSLDGISYYADDEDDIPDTEDLYKLVASELGVEKVTSIHADDCDPVAAWVTFIPLSKRPTSADYASEITSMLNGGGLKSKEFCEAMLREHKTLQQSFTRLCREWFDTLANAPDRCFDGRNEASQELAKLLAPYLHKVPLPFI